jgi:hypothetical protein
MLGTKGCVGIETILTSISSTHGIRLNLKIYGIDPYTYYSFVNFVFRPCIGPVSCRIHQLAPKYHEAAMLCILLVVGLSSHMVFKTAPALFTLLDGYVLTSTTCSKNATIVKWLQQRVITLLGLLLAG